MKNHSKPWMIRASALYIVIIIALVIGIICSSLIVTGYFYRLRYQKVLRYDRLLHNVSSGVNIILAEADTAYSDEQTIDLFEKGDDSITIKKIFWGLYEIGTVKSFKQEDTLYKAFSFANSIDSSKWAALYIPDNKRPIGISGQSTIIGDVFIPNATIQAAYIDNKPYNGDRRLVIGNKRASQNIMPSLDTLIISRLTGVFKLRVPVDSSFLKNDSLSNSFFSSTRVINLGKSVYTLKKNNIRGNIIIISDTTLFIDSSVTLKNVMIFAKSISVKNGFKGNAQFFATDSIGFGSDCHLNYPSCIGMIKSKETIPVVPMILNIGTRSTVNGIVFMYQKFSQPANSSNANAGIINIGKKVAVTGQMYTNCSLRFDDSVTIYGSVFASQLLYKTAFTTYANYLVNIKIDETALSPYYLTSELLPVTTKKKKILQWLEKN